MLEEQVDKRLKSPFRAIYELPYLEDIGRYLKVKAKR
jgi:hypothetical protein